MVVGGGHRDHGRGGSIVIAQKGLDPESCDDSLDEFRFSGTRRTVDREDPPVTEREKMGQRVPLGIGQRMIRIHVANVRE
ncbi:MAG: hypothetical protein M1313_00280 [Nitrospirae bacterium]|nr:hypothetical protein [Nitrospirota bacterium]